MSSLLVILFILFIMTFLIPVLSISTLKMFGLIPDFKLEDRKYRVLPFVFTSCFYIVTTYAFYSKIHVNLILDLLICISLLLLVLTAITYFWKISIHSATMGGVAGFLLALQLLYPTPSFMYPLAIVLVTGGLVMSARLYLQAHTPSQVYAGAIVGFAICYFVLVSIH